MASLYRDEAVATYFANFMLKVIAIFKSTVIFAFGDKAGAWIKQFILGACYVQQLPHPAGDRRGFPDETYRAADFWLVTGASHKYGIIDTDEGSELAKIFLDYYATLLARI